MKNKLKYIYILFCLLIHSCGGIENKSASSTTSQSEMLGENNQLILNANSDKVLILFPCFPCDAENTMNELKIKEWVDTTDINVILLDFNRHLWLKDSEKDLLTKLLSNLFESNDLPMDDIYIGGFSGGGNVSLLLSNHLHYIKSDLAPKGVFIIDAPIDLHGLYEVSKNVIKKNFSPVAVEEAKWIVKDFKEKFGTGSEQLINFQKRSPYVMETETIDNLMALKNTKLRFYIEPAKDWWLKERQTPHESTNAYFIDNLSQTLKSKGFDNVELIKTKDKGYRANGDRHPHSWSIMNLNGLLEWME